MSSVISKIQNHDCYKAAARHYETALQKTSENTRLWGVIGIALIAIALAIIGLTVWGGVQLFTSHWWTHLFIADKVIIGIFLGELGGPITLAVLGAVTIPLFYVGGAILYKAMTHRNPNVQRTDIYGENGL